MINWIWKTRGSIGRYDRFARDTGLPYVFCASLREVRELFEVWGLNSGA